MEYTTPVSSALDAAGIAYRLFKHLGEVHSLEQAALERGQRPEQVVRSILFRLGEGDFVMVLMAGPAQVSWSALRRYLGQSRLTMASEEEVREFTGYEIGAVSPVGLLKNVRILVDESVVDASEISIGSGARGITVIIKSQDLLAALKSYELANFQKAREE